jgi:hypothetical protein
VEQVGKYQLANSRAMTFAMAGPSAFGHDRGVGGSMVR